jgi:hypothetical protein
MTTDKQLCGIRLEDVLEKRRLDQALNAKEFAVAAGISYSTAREWFRLPGFPAFRGVVFWADFVQWRAEQTRLIPTIEAKREPGAAVKLPARAMRILNEP